MEYITPILTQYSIFKVSLSDSYGLSEDLLHVHAGLLIFFSSAVLSRKRIRSLAPMLITYAVAIVNEIVDAFTPGTAATMLEPLIDILNTVFWPTMLFLLARRRMTIADPSYSASQGSFVRNKPIAHGGND